MTALTAAFVRPADVIAYAVGDLVANAVAAGAVVPLPFPLPAYAGSLAITRGRLFKSSPVVANAAFMLHLYEVAAPVPANGDNGVLLTNGGLNYLGAISFPAPVAQGAGGNPFSDGARFDGVPVTGPALLARMKPGAVLYGLLEARGAYTPANAEQFSVTLELAQAD